MKKTIFIIIFVLTATLCAANEPAAAGDSPLYFRRLSTSNGTQSDVTTSILQDSYGFIWIGTSSGVFRYDGYNLIPISGRDGMFINGGVHCLLEVGEYVYAGSSQGLFRIHTATRRIERMDISGNDQVRALMCDCAGNLWIGTNTGLLKWNGAIVAEYNTYNSDISHNTVRVLYEDSGGGIWVGTHDGLNLMKSDGTFVHYFFKGAYKPELQNNLILDIQPGAPGDDSVLLIGTETGFVRFDRGTGFFSVWHRGNSELSDEVVKCIYTTDGEIWMGTNFGLNIMNRVSGNISSYFHESLVPHTISNNMIWGIMRDAGNTLWLLTGNGINCLGEQGGNIVFHNVSYSYEGREIGKQIRGMHAAADEVLYAATDNGIVRSAAPYDRIDDMQAVNRLLLMPNINNVTMDAVGRLWIATTGGLNIYCPQTEELHAFTTKNIPLMGANFIAAVKDFDDGYMYIAIWESGIFRTPQASVPQIGATLEKVNPSPTDKFAVRDNTMWFEKYNRLFSINMLNGYETEIFPIGDALGGDVIETLFQHNGTLYIGTRERVLKYVTATGAISSVVINTPYRESVINLTADSEGTIWGTTAGSLFRLGDGGGVTVMELGSDLPLKKIHHNSLMISPTGTMFCGGDDGFISLDPARITVSDYSPPAYITSLDINNREVGIGDGSGVLSNDIFLTGRIRLHYNQRNIALGFASMDFGSSHATRYRYMLEGLDRDWTYAVHGGSRAIYSNLSPGNYVFRIQAAGNNGKWGEPRSLLRIRVDRPFMFSIPFIIMYALLAVAFAVWLFRISTKRIRLLSELRMVRMEKEHNEAMTRSKIDFFTNISHEFRTPLTLIIPPLREAMELPGGATKERLIEIAYLNSEKLLRLVNQLLDFRKTDAENSFHKVPGDIIAIIRKSFGIFRDSAERSDIVYKLTAQPGSLVVECDPDKIETVIYNLLSNAFKFTAPGGTIFVDVKLMNGDCDTGGDTLEITVADTGIGIPEGDSKQVFKDFFRSKNAGDNTSGSGIGLSVVRQYVELHGGTVSVTSEEGCGSSFVVTLPVTPVSMAPDVRPERTGEERQSGVAGITARDTILEKYIDDTTGVKDTNSPLILYVEDNPTMVEFVKLSLGRKYNIVSASDGREGYEKALELGPQVVVSDIMMPGTDGLEMSRMLKENPRTRHIPIIILSAKPMAQDYVEGLRAGVDTYLVKPAYPEVLDAAIERTLERRRQMEEHFRTDVAFLAHGGAEIRDVDKKLMDDIINLIEANLSDPDLSVETLGSAIGISSAHLYRRIKQLTGLSTNQLIRKYRLRKASFLIKSSKGNISEVMYYVGFTSPSYFTKCFRAEFGMLPTEYRDREE